MSTATVSTGAALAPASTLSPRNAPFWKVTNHGASPAKLTSADELALKHLAREDELVAFFLIADRIADDGAFHRGRQLGNEVAHLVGVRHQDELRLLRSR